jgi:hypothetical protein
MTAIGAAQAAYGIGSGINSTVKGSQAAGQAEGTLENQENKAGELFNKGQQGFDKIANFDPLSSQFAQNTQAGIGALGGQLGGIANDTQQSLMEQAIGAFGGVDFGGLDQIQGQAQDNALAFGDRARTTAREQSALAFAGGADKLNDALAGRGIAGNSGVAGAALGQLAQQGAQQQSELNRSLADMQGQTALGAAQFDVTSGLQRGALDLNAANSQFGNNLAGAQFNAGLIGQGAELQRDALLTPLGMQQQFLTSNIQNPQLAALGMLNPAGLFGAGMGGLDSVNQFRQRQVENAGAGKGASAGMVGGGFGQMEQGEQGKGAVPGNGPNIPGA